jgi:transposase
MAAPLVGLPFPARPASAGAGAVASQPADHRRLHTGSPWAEIPERYGPSTTCYNRFVRWAKIGVWDRIFEAISRAYDGDLQMIDSSSIRVHQHGANGKKGGPKKRRPPLGTSLEPAAWGAREAD